MSSHQTYSDEAVALSAVETKLEEMPELPVDVRRQLAQHAEAFLEGEPDARSHPYSGSRVWRWAIRNDHLDLVAAIAPVAVALAAFSTPVAGDSTALTVTLLLAVITVARQVDLKAGNLGNDEMTVLMALKRRGPCTTEDIAGELNGLRLVGPGVWTNARVHEVLTALTSVRLRDGTFDAFAVSKDGIWSANGV